MRRGTAGTVRLHWLGMLLLGWLVLMLLTFSLALAQETKETETKKPWTGKLADGKEITRADLDRILQAHDLWLRSEGKEGQRANLSGAFLYKADLRRANLAKANLNAVRLNHGNLSKANLDHVNLSGAHLEEVNLSNAYLREIDMSKSNLTRVNLSNVYLGWANLSNANLVNANLSEAFLPWANLSGAILTTANLSGAHLEVVNLSNALMYGVHLSGAKLISVNLRGAYLEHAHLNSVELLKTDLSGANLNKANLRGTIFEPKPGTVSDVSLLLNIKGLASLRYGDSSHGLVELRETYKKAGMREPERELTYALNHNRRVKLWEKSGLLNKVESIFNLVCFEWTCQYGMNPGRPLEILGLGLFLFTFPYLLALRSRNRETGLWLILPPDRILGQGSKVHPFKLTGRTPFRPLPSGRWSRLKARLRRGLRRVRLAFYFSLLSAFNLGWREFNVGNWISRLQKHEYTLRATGWPRTVAGLQSLLSVYLLALWVLTYFGRPFD